MLCSLQSTISKEHTFEVFFGRQNVMYLVVPRAAVSLPRTRIPRKPVRRMFRGRRRKLNRAKFTFPLLPSAHCTSQQSEVIIVQLCLESGQTTPQKLRRNGFRPRCNDPTKYVEPISFPRKNTMHLAKMTFEFGRQQRLQAETAVGRVQILGAVMISRQRCTGLW